MIKDKNIMLGFFVLIATASYMFFMVGYQHSKPQFIPYPERKPFIVEYKNDCYASKDFTHEILSAKDTQELLKQLNDRKLK